MINYDNLAGLFNKRSRFRATVTNVEPNDSCVSITNVVRTDKYLPVCEDMQLTITSLELVPGDVIEFNARVVMTKHEGSYRYKLDKPKNCVKLQIKTITKEDIDEVLSKHPTLGLFGFGRKEDKQSFYDSIDQIQVVVNTLASVGKTQRINKNTSSYGLKHWVEAKHCYKVYVANGSFIVGAILSGFDLVTDTPNAYFNISMRDIRYPR